MVSMNTVNTLKNNLAGHSLWSNLSRKRTVFSLARFYLFNSSLGAGYPAILSRKRGLLKSGEDIFGDKL